MVVVNRLTRVWSGWEQDLEIVQDKGRLGIIRVGHKEIKNVFKKDNLTIKCWNNSIRALAFCQTYNTIGIVRGR